MPPFAFSAQITDDQLRIALNVFLRGQYRLIRIMGVALIVLSVVPLALGDVIFGVMAMLLGLVMISVAPALNTWVVLRKIRDQLARPTEYRIDEDGAWISNDLAESTFRWPGVDRLEEAPGMLIARVGKAGFFAIPTGGLPLTTASALTAFVRSQVPAQR
ncbi:hypothetical protein FB565_001953 [Actinoplanes lutulentus]|uniref:YcxB-like protein n=1 Tax=Actinoplanes lutulentus TaxID=1287878 RepID=A0A327ZCN0_9ACTN|nr:YcxB family protein [Actinoplanes lutulentus]MBB2942240.1 hypothetical protein [Actinoplanes lutulentus]RAK33009.1 hypothetical protein B0I29_11240 [Actinoplanes lutulentus]